jgi:hypothetical protein
MRKNTGTERKKEAPPNQLEVKPGSDDGPAPFAYRNLNRPSVRFGSRFTSRFNGPPEPDAGRERLKGLNKAEFISELSRANEWGVEHGFLEELVIQPEPVELPKARNNGGRHRTDAVSIAVERRRTAEPANRKKMWPVLYRLCIPGHETMEKLERKHAEDKLSAAVRLREKRARENTTN